MNTYFNYILNGFSVHQACVITAIARWIYDRSVAKHPNDGNLPLKDGQEPPMPFLAVACALYPQVAAALPNEVLFASEEGGEAFWQHIWDTTTKWLEDNQQSLPQSLSAPRIPRVGELDRDECHHEAWYEATLQEMDDFINDWRTKSRSQETFDAEDGIRYCDAYPERMETSLFFEQFFTWEGPNRGDTDDE